MKPRVVLPPALTTALMLTVACIIVVDAQVGTREQPASNSVERIEIKSSAWNGRKVVAERLVIRATKAGYLARNRVVPRAAIRELLQRLTDTPRSLSLEALGLDQSWLGQNAFTNEASFLKAAKRYYEDSVVLDADAEITLELWQTGRPTIRVQSRNSQAFMLPLRVTTCAGALETYDAGVSRAIAHLLPEGFVNKSRLEGRPHGVDFGLEIKTAVGAF